MIQFHIDGMYLKENALRLYKLKQIINLIEQLYLFDISKKPIDVIDEDDFNKFIEYKLINSKNELRNKKIESTTKILKLIK